MKLTDKRFWIFEALAILSTATTIGIMQVCLGRFELDGDSMPIFCIILTSYLVGQTVAWKVSKCLKWLKLGLSTYFYSIISFLGGDVYKLVNGRIKSTSDSWYCDREKSETLHDYVVRSYNITCDYIRNYPDKTNTFFSIVIEQREDEI